MFPWANPQVTEFIKQALLPGTRVFEWGPGASTLFFLSRGCIVTAVEHLEEYAEELRERTPENQKVRLDLHVIPPGDKTEHDPADPWRYTSSEDNRSYKEYVGKIHDHPAGYDFVYVDGRARPACLRHAQIMVKPGGWVALHDAQRKHYEAARHMYDGWREMVFPDVVWIEETDSGLERPDVRIFHAWRKPR